MASVTSAAFPAAWGSDTWMGEAATDTALAP